MKIRNSLKKLSLNKETICRLNDIEMQQLVGGEINSRIETVGCVYDLPPIPTFPVCKPSLPPLVTVNVLCTAKTFCYPCK